MNFLIDLVREFRLMESLPADRFYAILVLVIFLVSVFACVALFFRR